ncbi:hypothetical protein GIB67_008136 [Kingdonia uniflora]|uniref:Cysteinyl-tRNA synthetase n=1 Tax=Kingdonia uniflora TaxID=39325 RepID=A0A7J7MT52_9MAGN|nr:hypothetical protein GIB67_008136 [Kingdonia uniflora]
METTLFFDSCGEKVVLEAAKLGVGVGVLEDLDEEEGDSGIRQLIVVTPTYNQIIKRANLKKEDPLLLSNAYCQKFMEDIADLQYLPPTHEPRVSTHMDQIKQMIATIIDNGYAYEVEGDLYFSIDKISDYGRLSGQKVEDSQPVIILIDYFSSANMDYHPLVVRYFLMSAHYRSHMDYTKEQLEIASDSVYYIYQKKPQPSVFQSFDALESKIKELLKILGLLWPPSYLEILESLKEKVLKRANIKLDYVLQKIEERAEARKHRDYLKADEIRQNLASKGIIFMDEGEKTVWRPMRPSATP